MSALDDRVVAWEWPGGWRLVRPLTLQVLRTLLGQMADSGRFVGLTGTNEVAYEVIRAETRDVSGKEARLFLVEPGGEPVLVLTIEVENIFSHVDERMILSLMPGHHRSHTLEHESQWWEAVRRVYGMAAQLAQYFEVAEEEFPLAPLSATALLKLGLSGPEGAYARLGSRLGHSTRANKAGGILEALGPWLVPGAPSPELDLLMLLGEPLRPFVSRTRDLVAP